MKYKGIKNSSLLNRSRVVDLNIMTPKIRSEFYVRLFSFLSIPPEISYEGYEFFITNENTGIEFSAGLTGFGVGYFSENNTQEVIDDIKEFDDFLFKEFNNLKDCKIEIDNDFGTSIFGFENGELIELDIEA